MRERGSVLLILRTFRPGAWCCRTWSARRHGVKLVKSRTFSKPNAHEELLNVALTRAKLDRHETHWLMVAYRTQANRLLGIASFAEYSERVLGHTPRVTEERLRVARALQDLPALAQALETGHSTGPQCVSSPALPHLRPNASGSPLRTAARSAKSNGWCAPSHAEPNPTIGKAQKHALHLDVRPETLAVFREAADRLRRRALARDGSTHASCDAQRLELRPHGGEAVSLLRVFAFNMPMARTMASLRARGWRAFGRGFSRRFAGSGFERATRVKRLTACGPPRALSGRFSSACAGHCSCLAKRRVVAHVKSNTGRLRSCPPPMHHLRPRGGELEPPLPVVE